MAPLFELPSQIAVLIAKVHCTRLIDSALSSNQPEDLQLVHQWLLNAQENLKNSPEKPHQLTGESLALTALYYRDTMIPDRVTLADWALSESQVDMEIISRVTVLYARNLNLATTEQTLRDLFNAASNQSVQKVKMMRDFAFIHFLTRESAQQAMDQLNSETFVFNHS
jgi:hypothetical protein